MQSLSPCKGFSESHEGLLGCDCNYWGFEGVVIHFEPIAVYNDNWRL
jgi:hypothetical protein